MSPISGWHRVILPVSPKSDASISKRISPLIMGLTFSEAVKTLTEVDGIPGADVRENGRDGDTCSDCQLYRTKRGKSVIRYVFKPRNYRAVRMRVAASLGVRVARTQVTPRILKLSSASSGRCPKYCDVRHTKWLAYPYMRRLFEHESLRSNSSKTARNRSYAGRKPQI